MLRYVENPVYTRAVEVVWPNRTDDFVATFAVPDAATRRRLLDPVLAAHAVLGGPVQATPEQLAAADATARALMAAIWVGWAGVTDAGDREVPFDPAIRDRLLAFDEVLAGLWTAWTAGTGRPAAAEAAVREGFSGPSPAP